MHALNLYIPIKSFFEWYTDDMTTVLKLTLGLYDYSTSIRI